MGRFQHSEYRAAFGSVLQALRQDQGRSRAWLAQASGVSVSRLSQIEHGEASPDESCVVKLAHALDTTPTTVWSRTCECFAWRIQLDGLLDDLGIPHEYRGEFFGLEPNARDALIRALAGRVQSTFQRRVQIRDIEAAIERDGVEPSVQLLLSGIGSHGLSPADYYRAAVEFEEMPGSRSVFTDRLPINPVEVPIDRLFLYRANFGVEPPNPMLLKWWAQSRRSALDIALSEYDSRTIIPIDLLARYISTGERSRNVMLPPELVKLHIVAMIELLRTNKRYRLGLAETRFPLVYKLKADHHVQATVYERQDGRHTECARTTLLFSRPTVVRRFSEHFECAWDAIPGEFKDNGAIARWLEDQLAHGTGQGGR